jgi:hypothetical protein
MSGQWCLNISDRDDVAPACCAEPAFASWEDCQAAVMPYIDASVEAAVDAGLELSADCLRTMMDTTLCADASTGSFLACENDCQVLFGDKPEGAECEAMGHRMSDCEQGLICAVDRTCRNPCELSLIASEGEYCGPTRGMWFVSCDTGLACAADGTCQPGQVLGGACDALAPCAVESWCDLSGLCVAKLSGTSPCDADAQCASDICKDGVCYEPASFACGRSAW